MPVIKYRNFYLLASFLMLTLFSCRDDYLSEQPRSFDSEFMVVNEKRLHFSSSDFLRTRVEKSRKNNAEFEILELPNLTKRGFYSLRPLIDHQNTSLLEAYKYRENHNVRIANEQFEELITDDYFAFFLNDEGEMQVGDSIYKYTEDGLYFVHFSDIDHLYEYLNMPTSNAKIKPCDIAAEDGTMPLDDKIKLFVPDCGVDDEIVSGGGSGGSYNPPTHHQETPY